jgi:RimJ/RimL family protein N-acetyltransferase
VSKNIWEGSKVRLRAIEEADWERHFEWDQDSDMARLSYMVFHPRSCEATRRATQETSLKQPENDEYAFAVETLAGEHVGGASTHHCDLRSGTFSYGLAIQSTQRRQGYASDAIYLILRYMFEERRYQKVNVNVYAFNEASIRLHDKMGFQLEGRLRRTIYTEGEFHDMLYYGMTAEEFAQRYSK